MFYAHFVLAKKGPLSRIWLAAHWDKKLTKAHVFETSIEQSVDGILQPKVKMALRTSGHLLLGVVRIYSRKAKYLLADCNEAFVKIKMAFRPGMSIDVDLPLASDGGIENREAAVNAITLPEIFHDFDTQIQVNGDGSSEMDLILNGGGSDDVDVNTGNVFQSSVTRVEEITMREDFGVNSTLQLENVDDGFGEIHDELGDVVGNDSTSFNNNINHQPLDFDDLSSFGFPTPTNMKKKLPPSESENIEDESLLRGDNSKASVAVVEEDGEISKDNNSIAIHDSLGVDKEVGLFEDTPEETAPTLPETSKDHHPHLDATDAEDNLTTTDMEDNRPSHVFDDTDDHPPHVFDDTDDHFGSAAATGMDDSAGLDHSISDHEEDIIQKDDELSKKDEEHRNVVEAESFALAPVDATMLPAGRKGNGHGLPFPSASINGQPSSSSGVTIVHKRKRKLVVDEVKAIAGEEMKAQLSDTSDIVCSLDLAPPTKRLMLWKESGGVDKLFLNQCKQTTSSSSTISLNNLFPNSISSVNIQDLLENCYSSSGSSLGGCSAALFLHAFYSQKLQLVLVPEYESYNRVDDVHGTLMDVVSRNVKKNEKMIPSLKLSLKTKGTIVGSSQSTNEPEDGYADNDDGMADYGADPTDSGEYQTGTDDYHHEDDLNFGDDRPTNNFNNDGDGDDFGSNNNSKSPQYTPDGVLIIPRVHKKRGRPSNKTLQEIQERQEKASDLNSEMTDMSSFSKDAKRVRREEEGVDGDQLSITNEKFMKESNNIDHDESGISNDTSRRGRGGEVVTEELNITCGGATSGIASSIVSSSGGTHFVNGVTTKTHSEENHQEEGEMTRLKRHNLLSPDNEENLFMNHSSLLNNTNSSDIVLPNEADERIVGIHQKEDETSEQYEDRVLNTRAKHLIVTLRGRFNTSVRGQEEKFSFNDLLTNTEDGSTKQKRKRVAQSFYSLLVLQKLNAVHLSQEEGLLGVKSDYLLQKSSISAPILIRKGVNFAQTTLLV